MKPESLPSSEQGLVECRQSGGAFDHEFTQTPLAKHVSFTPRSIYSAARITRTSDISACACAGAANPHAWDRYWADCMRTKSCSSEVRLCPSAAASTGIPSVRL